MLILASAALFFLLCAATCDPGFLSPTTITTTTSSAPTTTTAATNQGDAPPPPSSAYPPVKHALGDVNHPAIWSGLCWDQLCTQCKLVRPLRARHCAACGRYALSPSFLPPVSRASVSSRFPSAADIGFGAPEVRARVH